MRWILALAGLLAFAACDAHDHDGHAHEGDVLLYVANQGSASVSVFNTRLERVVETVDLTALGFTANARPHHVSVEPDGSAWYVSLIGDGAVVKLSRDNRVLGRVTTEAPGMLALDPDGHLLFAGRSMSAPTPPASIAFIDRRTMTLEDERPVVFPRPHALGFAGGMVVTASLGQNRLATLPLEGGVVFSQATGTPTSLAHLGFAPDGTRLVVTGEPGGTLYFMRRGQGGALTQDGALTVGGRPWHPHFTPDGAEVYVPLKGADAVAVIDAATRAEVRRITGAGLAEPHGIAFSDDGRTAYVSNANTAATYATQTPGAGTLVLLDTRTGQVRKVVEVGANPAGMGRAGAHGGH